MARPRQFDEIHVLDAVTEHFWRHGYSQTSLRDLGAATGLTNASLYNAFGDKRGLYRKVLERYVDSSILARIARCKTLPPLVAIRTFFAEVIQRSVDDPARKGCMLVNASLDTAPRDAEFAAYVEASLGRIEAFFRERVTTGQQIGEMTCGHTAEDHARHLLAVLVGVRVLARSRPDRKLLESMAAPAIDALSMQDSTDVESQLLSDQRSGKP